VLAIDKKLLTPLPPIAVNEESIAAAMGLSVFFLRKDRQTKRRIPFYRIGGAIRYNPETVRQALALMQEGGTRRAGGTA